MEEFIHFVKFFVILISFYVIPFIICFLWGLYNGVNLIKKSDDYWAEQGSYIMFQPLLNMIFAVIILIYCIPIEIKNKIKELIKKNGK